MEGSTWDTFDMTPWDWNDVTIWTGMFKNCKNLKTLTLPENIKSQGIKEMVRGCTSLTSITFGDKWDTSKVTNITRVFYGCSSLTSLDVSNWDTSNVTYMGQLFYNCYALTEIKGIEDWDTSNVTDMYYMFNSCTSLTSLDLSGWDTSNVTDMEGMFYNCKALTELRMGGDVSKVTNVGIMFNLINTTGTFYYNSQYDYSKIIAQLPSTWTAVPY